MTKKITIKKVKTTSLGLSLRELIFLRDLFSVRISPVCVETVSQTLASGQEYDNGEIALYNKVCSLCKSFKIPVEEEAPDYAIVMETLPKMTVVPINVEEELEESEIDEPEDEESSTQLEKTEPEAE